MRPDGMSFGCLKWSVLVPMTELSDRPWARRAISLLLAASQSWASFPWRRCRYSSIFPVSVLRTALIDSTMLLTVWLLKYFGFSFFVRELVRSGCPFELVCRWNEGGGVICCSACASSIRLEMRVFIAASVVISGLGASEGLAFLIARMTGLSRTCLGCGGSAGGGFCRAP